MLRYILIILSTHQSSSDSIEPTHLAFAKYNVQLKHTLYTHIHTYYILLLSLTALVAQTVKRLLQVHTLGPEDPLEKETAPHSSTLAWKNPMDGGAWRATVHEVAKSQTRLSDFTFLLSFMAILIKYFKLKFTIQPGIKFLVCFYHSRQMLDLSDYECCWLHMQRNSSRK